jgi:hypothetical protein
MLTILQSFRENVNKLLCSGPPHKTMAQSRDTLRGLSVVYFPNDNAHCEGIGCTVCGACLRYVALQYKGDSATRVVMVSPDPKSCTMFVPVAKSDVLSVGKN